MDKKRATILILLGPTASGKSDLAVKLAKKFDGEVISADSRQVYRGLDIGSGKITKKEMGGVPHHLLDIANPKARQVGGFSVAQYQKLANKKIAEIIKRGKLPIICGGTGFYIQAVTDNLILPEVKPDAKLRHKLENKTATQLYVMLRNLDKARAENIDQNNKRRLIRAIEIAQALGKVPGLQHEPKHSLAQAYDVIFIGLKLEKEKLRQNIKTRLQKRLKSGLIAELKNLHERDKLSWKRLENFGLEYRFVALYLQNKMTKPEMIEKLETAIWHYAKRQMTWWKRDEQIKWLEPRAVLPYAKRALAER